MSAKDLSFGVQSDGVVAFWGPRAGSRVRLTVQLPLHEEVAFLFEVQVTVSTHKALGVPVLIPGLDDSTSVGRRQGYRQVTTSQKEKREGAARSRPVSQSGKHSAHRAFVCDRSTTPSPFSVSCESYFRISDR